MKQDGDVFKSLDIYNCRIPSSVRIEGIVTEVIASIQGHFGQLNDSIIFDLKVILNEIVINAIKHGNKEDTGKYVSVEVKLVEGDCLSIAVQDEGGGYNFVSTIRSPDRDADICDVSELMECGRGLQLVRALCDSSNVDDEGRTIVTIRVE